MTKDEIESDLIRLQETVEVLKSKMDLLEIIVKQPKAPQAEETQVKLVKVIQINMGKKSYFCKTAEEQQIFAENNPGVKTESFNIELQEVTAEKHLNDPENKKQFTKKEI